MKHLIFSFGILLVITSCRKQDMQTAKIEMQNSFYRIENGIVVFNSFKSYEDLFKPEFESRQIQLINDLSNRNDYQPLYSNIQKYRQEKKFYLTERLIHSGIDSVDQEIDDLLDSSLLTTIVNHDGIVQIGDYLFNINVIKDSTFALHTSLNNSTNYQALLNENIALSQILRFSNSDEALTILEEHNYPTTMPTNGWYSACSECRKCDESSAAKIKVKGVVESASPGYFDYHMYCKVVYQRAAIYFSLMAKNITSVRSNEFAHKLIWGYKPRCKDQVPSGGPTATNQEERISYEDKDHFTSRLYQGGRALNKYYLKAVMFAGGPAEPYGPFGSYWLGPPHYLFTSSLDQYEIKYNWN